MDTALGNGSNSRDDAQVLVDISDIIVSEESVAALQGQQLWMRPERDVGH